MYVPTQYLWRKVSNYFILYYPKCLMPSACSRQAGSADFTNYYGTFDPYCYEQIIFFPAATFAVHYSISTHGARGIPPLVLAASLVNAMDMQMPACLIQ